MSNCAKIIEHDPDMLIRPVKAAQDDGSLPRTGEVIKVVGVIAAAYAEHLDSVRCGEKVSLTENTKE